MSLARTRANSDKETVKGVREGKLEREPKELAQLMDEINTNEALAERAAREILKKHKGMKLVGSVARYCAEKPNVGAVVILDLYTQERPLLIECFFRDGEDVRERPRLPTPQLERSLREFIYVLQSDLG
jgi:hypothetical protein